MTITIQRSMASGEVSPYLYARVDQVKYQTGLYTCRNMQVLRHGGAQSRPATTFVGEVKSSAAGPVRTVKFVFNASQTYHLEFGNLYIRFVQNGQQVVEAIVPITGISKANPAVVTAPAHGYSNGQEVFLTGVVGMTQMNGRNLIVQNVTTNTFTVQNKDGSNLDSTAFTTYVSGGTVARIYELASPYAQADVPLLEYAQSGDQIVITHASYPPQVLSRVGNTSWTIAAITFAPVQGAPTSPTVTSSGAGGDKYAITAVSAATGEESLPVTVQSTAIATSGAPLTVGWTAPTGAVPAVYNIYKNSNGVFGFIGSSGMDGVTVSFKDVGITANTLDTPPSVTNPFVGTATWAATGAMAGARARHFSFTLQNGKVFVGAGVSNVGTDSEIATCELYDPSTALWSPANSMALGRKNFGAVLLNNGKVLVTGGAYVGVGNGTASCELYDPVAGTWSSTGSMSVARVDHTLTVMANGNVIAIGGDGNGATSNTCEIYNVLAGTWSATGSMTTARNNHTATLLNTGNVLVAAGENSVGAMITSCEVYNAIAGTWSVVGSLATARLWHTATLLPNGTVIVIGGSTDFTNSTTVCEIFDPVAQTWSATGSLSTGRFDHTATLFSNGQILVSGGYTSGTTATSTTELYSELSAIFTSGGAMPAGRSLCAASILPSGAVVVSGGAPSGVSPTSLKTVGLYTPGQGNYPATTAIYQQRLVFGNTNNNPQQAQGSRTGNFYNFTTSTPIQDDDAVTFSLAGTQVQPIKHMADLGQLIIFTAAGEFSIIGDANGALTPSAVNARQHSYCGSNQLRPLIVGSNAIFVQARGGVVRDLAFDWQVNGYRGNDLTLFSTHLFDGHQIVDWDYAQIPNYTVWAAREDGVLLGLTYIHEQQIFGWHRHDLQDGFVENVLSIPEGQIDAVYLVVRRVINGRTVRYIERMSNRFIAAPVAGQFPLPIASFVGADASLSYNGWNTTAITMTLSSAGTWLYTDTLTLTASGAYFTASMVGSQIFLVGADGQITRCTIAGYTSATVVSVTADKTVPANLRAVAVSQWALAIQTISGLYHLIGEKLSVLGDGLVVASPNNSKVTFTVTVSALGVAVLDRPYAVINAGKPMTCDLETLDLDVEQGETLADKAKLIGQVNVYVAQTRGIFAGAREPGSDFDGATDPLDALSEFKIRGIAGESYNDPVGLFSGLAEIDVEPSFTRNGHVFIRQVDPLPLTVLAIAPAGFITTKGAEQNG